MLNSKIYIAVIVVLRFMTTGVATLKCICNPDDCDVIRSLDCPGKGIILWDPCKCCRVCAKTLGEACGGLNGFSGTCEAPLQCILKPSIEQSGTCMDFSTNSKLDCDDKTTLDPGCEIVNGRCKCWKNIRRCKNSMHHWSYKNIVECQLNLKSVIERKFVPELSISKRSFNFQ